MIRLQNYAKEDEWIRRKINGGQQKHVLIFWYDCVHIYCDFMSLSFAFIIVLTFFFLFFLLVNLLSIYITL